MKRIVLIGFRGSGKTSVGRKLAETLSLPFIDTDTLIEEQTGMTITDIFASEGEREFRRYERNVVISLPVEECVISTGGGVVLDWENVRHLRKDSMVFYLEAPELVILERITGSDRPAQPEGRSAYAAGGTHSGLHPCGRHLHRYEKRHHRNDL
jgi:shikimate dehydrogenase